MMEWTVEQHDGETFLVPKRSSPCYELLETSYDVINKKTWYKIAPDNTMANLIVRYGSSNFEIRAEITGEKYLWITEHALLLANIAGAQRLND